MKRKLFFILFAVLGHAVVTKSQSIVGTDTTQASDSYIHFCGAGGEYAKYVNDAYVLSNNSREYIFHPAYAPQSIFFPGQVEVCGMFKIYYQDYIAGLNQGFADPINGATRRATMCAVLSYIDSILLIPDTIDLFVAQSFSVGNPYTATNATLAYASPNYPAGFTSTQGIYNGNLYNHITTGIDPDVNQYDMTLTVNFHQYYFFGYKPINYLEDYTNNTTTCKFDLFSILLHEIGHTLGLVSFVAEDVSTHNAINGNSGNIFNNAFTLYDNLFLYKGSVVTNTFTKVVNTTNPLTPFINPAINSLTDPLRSNDIWLSNTPSPQNQPVYSGSYYNQIGYYTQPPLANSFMSHLNYEIGAFVGMSQYSPGYKEKYVMGPTMEQDDYRRRFTIWELRMLLEMGYNLDPVFSSATSMNGIDQNSSLLTTNQPAYRSNVGAAIAFPPTIPFTNFETPVPDFLLANNNTPANTSLSTLTINIPALPNIADNNGDPISIMPGSLYGIRGVSSGGNNHNLLNINPAGTQVVYTPEPGFTGLAQFAFNLWDGHEKGALKIITINVTASYVPPLGSDLVFNGNFERGTEVRLRFGDVNVPNTSLDCGVEGDYFGGFHLADMQASHVSANGWGPIGAGISILNSYHRCDFQSSPFVRGNFGYSTNSANRENNYETVPFPMNTGSSNERTLRYQGAGSINIFNLMDSVKPNRYYIIEFDVALGKGYFQSNAANQVVQFNIKSHSSVNINDPYNSPVIQSTFFNTTIPQINTNDTVGIWYHVVHPILYCGTSTKLFSISPISRGFVFIDNFSLRLDTMTHSFDSLIVSASDTTVCPGDSVRLVVAPNRNPCNIDYDWLGLGLNADTIYVNPNTTTSYTVVGTNGVDTDTATITINVFATPIVTATSSAQGGICQPYNDTLFASGADTYVWSPSTGLNATNNDIVIATPSSSTTYYVTGTDTNGCADTASVSVIISNTPLTVTIGTPTGIVKFCPGDSLLLIANSNAVNPLYQWTLNSVPINPSNNDSIYVSAVGNYICTVSDFATGCSGTSNTIAVTLFNAPPITLTAFNDTVCEYVFGLNSPPSFGLSPVPPVSATTTWYFNGDTLSPIPTIFDNDSLTGYYYVTVQYANGCFVSSDSVYILIYPKPDLSLTPYGSIATCGGDSILLTASSPTPGLSYSWTYNGNPAGTNNSIYVSAAGTASVLITEPLHGCQNFSTTPVYNAPDSICNQCILPNGDFEYYANPSTFISNILDVPFWNQPTSGSPDAYNAAFPLSSLVSVPNNTFSSHTPALSGNGYAGFYSYSASANYREYIQSILNCEMDSLQLYEVKFYLRQPNKCQYSTNNIGVYLSALPPSLSQSSPATPLFNTLGITPQFNTTNVYADTSAWGSTLPNVPYSFQVNGNGQKWITIGNFYDDNTTTRVQSYPSAQYASSYYFVDDISVKPVPPTVTQSPTGCLSSGSIVTLNLSGSPAYTVFNTATGITTLINNPVGTFTATVTATTTFIVKYSLSCGQCKDSTIYTVPVNPVISVNSPSICPGGTATLIASGGTGNLSYQWSGTTPTNNDTVTASPSTTTLYIVTVSDISTGCFTSAGNFVTVLPNPSFTVSSSSICSGTSATLTASNTSLNYTWSAGTTPSTGQSVSASPATTTVYTVTGTDPGTGCSATATSTVTVTTNTLNVSISASEDTVCPSVSSTLSASGASSYTWNTGATTASIVVSPTVTTTYTVTGTNGTCTDSATVTITALSSCCTGTVTLQSSYNTNGFTIFNVTTPSYYGITSNVDIGNAAGTSTVTLTFIGADVKVSPGMVINVFPNCTLNIVNSHFSACTDLWAGINIISNSNGTGIVNILANSFIEDAQNAVSTNRLDNFRLRTSVFNRNVNAVNISSATTTNSEMIIVGCVFTCRNISWPVIPSNFSTNTVRSGINTPPAVSAYTNAICKAPFNARSFRGIFLTDVTFAYLGTDPSGSNLNAGNLFDYLEFGIDMVQADLKVRKQTFQRMSGSATIFGGNVKGIAIRAKATKKGFTLIADAKNTNTPIINNSRNYFYDNGRNVDVTDYSNVEVNYTKMVNSSVTNLFLNNYMGEAGVFVKQSFAQMNYLNMSFNEITNCNSAINLASSSAALHGPINSNYNIINANAQGRCSAAIYLKFASSSLSSAYTPYHNVYLNTLTDVTEGIRVDNLGIGTNIFSNSISVRIPNSSSLSANGIRVTGCQWMNIDFNGVSGKTTNAVSNVKVRGIYATNSPNCIFKCNTINPTFNGANATYIGQGIVFESNCLSPQNVHNNTMANCYDGMVFLNNGVVGQQGLLNSPGLTNGTGSDNIWPVSATFTHSKTLTDNTTNINIVGPTYSPFYVRNTPSTNPASIFNLNQQAVASDALTFQQTLAAGTSCGGNGQQFAQSQQAALKEMVSATNTLPVFNNVTKWIYKNHVFASIEEDSTLLLDTTLYNFYSSSSGAIPNKLSEVIRFIKNKNYGLAMSVNNSISPSNVQEDNAKTATALTLSRLSDSLYAYDSTEIASMNIVATQCYLMGEVGVLEARAIVEIASDRIEFYSDNCESSEFRLAPNINTEEARSEIVIYPNPNNGSFTIEYNISDDAVLNLYSSTGAILEKFTLKTGASKMQVVLNQYENGLYFFKVLNGNSIVKTGKIVIHK